MQQTRDGLVWPELPGPVGDDDAMKGWLRKRKVVAERVREAFGFSESRIQDLMKKHTWCREHAIWILHNHPELADAAEPQVPQLRHQDLPDPQGTRSRFVGGLWMSDY